MTEMIGYCGYNCGECAARSDDPKIRQKLVDGWRRIFGHQMYTAENVHCDGCKSKGKIADTSCEARPCAKKKGVDSCALCDKFACEKVRGLLGSRDAMLVLCCQKDKPVTEEEYNLCMKQFDSFPNLVKILADAGKLDKWVLKKKR